jgi:hypothetical protein
MFGCFESRVSKIEDVLGMAMDKLESIKGWKKTKGIKRSGNASIKSIIIKKAAEKSITISEAAKQLKIGRLKITKLI